VPRRDALYIGFPSAYADAVPLTEEQLAGDLTRAMKARDAVRLGVLRGVLTAAKNLKVEKHGATLSDADLVQIIRKEIRKREEAEEFAAKAGREDVLASNRAERAILDAYAPPALGVGELEQAVREIAAQPDARSIGAVMAGLKTRFAGRLDGKLASDVARRVLAELASA